MDILCKSCSHCADGVGGNRRCYLIVDNPLPMPYISREEREHCKWYEHSDIPSNRRYSIERCPNCGNEIPVMLMESGRTYRKCERCGHHETKRVPIVLTG